MCVCSFCCLCVFSLLWTYTTVTWLDTCLIASSVKTFITLPAWATFAGLSTASVLTQQNPPPTLPATDGTIAALTRRPGWKWLIGRQLAMWFNSPTRGTATSVSQATWHDAPKNYLAMTTDTTSVHATLYTCIFSPTWSRWDSHGPILYTGPWNSAKKQTKPSLAFSVSTNDQLDCVSHMIDWIVYIYIYIRFSQS